MTYKNNQEDKPTELAEPAAEITLSDYRCACSKLLFRGDLQKAMVVVKCKRCGTLNTFRGRLDESS